MTRSGDGEHDWKAQWKKRKVLMIIVGVFAGLLFLIIGIICYLYFYSEQIQHRMKERICAKVIQYEEELSEIAEEWPPEAYVVVWEDSETEFEAIGDFGKYWYRTEKITDNWWYYERKDVWKYYVKK